MTARQLARQFATSLLRWALAWLLVLCGAVALEHGVTLADLKMVAGVTLAIVVLAVLAEHGGKVQRKIMNRR